MAETTTEQSSLEKARESLERMQSFDTKTLPRVQELGTALSFSAAIPPSDRLCGLYRQLPLEALDWIAEPFLVVIVDQANADYNRFVEMLEFDPSRPDASTTRDRLIKQVTDAYVQAFKNLEPRIAYGVSRVTDIGEVEAKARGILQGVEDETRKLRADIKARLEEADRIVKDIREMAAEQGASQQAIYFKEEADEHAKTAKAWLITTGVTTGVLAILAGGLLFLHNWSPLAPTSTYEAVQLTVAKVLLLGTAGSFAVIAARNYAANRHNAIVNRHRHNALLTYTALVDAAGHQANRDIVLQYAAHAIYFDQPTGFAKTDTSDGRSAPLVSFSNRGMAAGDPGHGA